MRQKRGTPGHKALLNILIDGRISNGLTQVELAEKLKVRQSYISNYETGERRLDAVELILVCEAIGIDPVGVIEQIVDVVITSPPRVLGPKRKRKSSKHQSATGRRGPEDESHERLRPGEQLIAPSDPFPVALCALVLFIQSGFHCGVPP